MADTNTTLISILANKPWISVAVTQSAFVTSLLTLIGVLTPIVGFIAACIGLIIGYYSLRIQYRKWKELKNPKKHHIHPKKS
jgi:hypothetical protein